MRLEDEYRTYAADALKLASKQPDNADKRRLLAMAEAWFDLADRIARRVKNLRATIDHPLVEQALGRDRPTTE